MPESPRNRPNFGNIFMQYLHLLRRYFVPLPWRFLAQPELQQGSDRLNCKQKHFLVLHAIKLIVYTSMNKLRAYFRVICALIRSWSDISGQHFPSLPPGELGFWRPEISSRRPEILYQLINRSVTDPRYYNGRGISRPNVEMNHNNIFMRHIFWSTWNAKVIAQSPAITEPQREEMADCLGPMLRKIVFHGH